MNMGKVILEEVREVTEEGRKQIILWFSGYFKDLGFTGTEKRSYWCLCKDYWLLCLEKLKTVKDDQE